MRQERSLDYIEFATDFRQKTARSSRSQRKEKPAEAGFSF
jgi:hypothetical protein